MPSLVARGLCRGRPRVSCCKYWPSFRRYLSAARWHAIELRHPPRLPLSSHSKETMSHNIDIHRRALVPERETDCAASFHGTHVRLHHRPDKLPSRQCARLICQNQCHGLRPYQSNSAPTPRYPMEAPLDGGASAGNRIAFDVRASTCTFIVCYRCYAKASRDFVFTRYA